MAEAVGLVSAILGLTIFAYDTSKSLHEAVSSFRTQRKTIKDLQDELNSLTTILGSIHTHVEGSDEVERLEPLQEPLKCCLTICQEMRETLQACTKHSAEGRDSVRDWLNMRYHGKSFEDIRKRLNSYKSTLSITFASINMRNHGITQESLNDLKDSIRGTKEDLEDQLDQIHEAIRSTDALNRATFQADQARLVGSLKSIEWAQQVADTTLPKVVVESNRAGQGTRTIFGTDTSQPQFSLNVSENEAGLGAIMAAGVHTPQTLQALLRDSQAQNLALTLQAAQAQSQNTNAPTLQSLLYGLSVGPLTGDRSSNPRISENANPGLQVPIQSIGSAHGGGS
ncbi:hypothetical protein BDV29DRAFT_177530 [Aspergillus leporis]|uniref:Azaphilone pigments biosynthesis cluster protein L N-terminal domain-containing protein n=1 Tax=Aspergillus leporis TaxID=41062 RepID=A0A5N5WYQ0_9EURO|nr:hypothetical protein BDV29DRAFT_177530 [Aspergillus leporis]